MREAKAAREVLISEINVQGIGQAERLKGLGIDVVHELKGVGENLRDHYAPRMKWTIPRSLALTYNVKGRGPRVVWEALKYLFTDKGLLGITAAPLRAFVRTREGLEAPNAVIGWVPFLVGENLNWQRNPVLRRLRTSCVRKANPCDLGRCQTAARDQFPHRTTRAM